ncbi:MAG TPA: molybdopterin molybdenumtransferase MoeA, partial [Clostridiaceae bacterium]|nr:molybdopterin molybdenumtransferase MoeA [Clostridiaceae bacterium]
MPDDFSKLREAIDQALKMSDIVVLSGGSSVGAKDMTAKAIESTEGGEIL